MARMCPGPRYELLGWNRGEDSELVMIGMARGYVVMSHFSDVINACACNHNSVDLHVHVCGSMVMLIWQPVEYFSHYPTYVRTYSSG